MKILTLREWQQFDDVKIIGDITPEMGHTPMTMTQYRAARSDFTCDFSALQTKAERKGKHESSKVGHNDNPCTGDDIYGRPSNCFAARATHTNARRFKALRRVLRWFGVQERSSGDWNNRDGKLQHPELGH